MKSSISLSTTIIDFHMEYERCRTDCRFGLEIVDCRGYWAQIIVMQVHQAVCKVDPAASILHVPCIGRPGHRFSSQGLALTICPGRPGLGDLDVRVNDAAPAVLWLWKKLLESRVAY